MSNTNSNSLVEKVLLDARELSERLRGHESIAEKLIVSNVNLQNTLVAMKKYQDYVTKLNEVARHRPKLEVVEVLSKENIQVRDLQQENKDLRQSLEEHQTTIELIMNKYREQIGKFKSAKQMEKTYLKENNDYSKELQEKTDKINEMAAVMFIASKCDSDDEDEMNILNNNTESFNVNDPNSVINCNSKKKIFSDSENKTLWSKDSLKKQKAERKRLINYLKDKNKLLRELLGLTSLSSNCIVNNATNGIIDTNSLLEHSEYETFKTNNLPNGHVEDFFTLKSANKNCRSDDSPETILSLNSSNSSLNSSTSTLNHIE